MVLGHYNVTFGLEEDVKDLGGGNCEILKSKSDIGWVDCKSISNVLLFKTST
jgi:hypothetical protein